MKGTLHEDRCTFVMIRDWLWLWPWLSSA